MKEHPTHKGYFVTEDGRVFSAWQRKGSGRWGTKIEVFIDTNNLKELSSHNNGKGYLVFCLRSGKKEKPRSKKCYAHRLVAETYLPNPNNLPEVNHINEIKNDNRVENLEWCDRQKNNEHSLAKKYLILETSSGNTFEIFNLNKWCRENSIKVPNLLQNSCKKYKIISTPFP